MQHLPECVSLGSGSICCMSSKRVLGCRLTSASDRRICCRHFRGVEYTRGPDANQPIEAIHHWLARTLPHNRSGYLL